MRFHLRLTVKTEVLEDHGCDSHSRSCCLSVHPRDHQPACLQGHFCLHIVATEARQSSICAPQGAYQLPNRFPHHSDEFEEYPDRMQPLRARNSGPYLESSHCWEQRPGNWPNPTEQSQEGVVISIQALGSSVGRSVRRCLKIPTMISSRSDYWRPRTILFSISQRLVLT